MLSSATYAPSASETSAIYPFAALRAIRIARMNEKRLGDFHLTEDSSREMAADDIGVLIGNCGDMRRIHEKLRDLADTSYPSDFVVVLQSKKMAATWYNEQAAIFDWKPVPASRPPQHWQVGCCHFTTFEGLQALSDSGALSKPVAAVLMVDPYLTTHNCRGFGTNRWTQAHDRPELVLNFRNEHAHGEVQPPLIFFSVPPAKSLNTKPAESVYGLATWWYADGRYLRVGEPPVV